MDLPFGPLPRSLVHQTRAISDEASVARELEHLHIVFKSNEYSNRQIQQAFQKFSGGQS